LKKENARFPSHSNIDSGIVITIMIIGRAVFHLDLGTQLIESFGAGCLPAIIR
jgi:hypothetical protein